MTEEELEQFHARPGAAMALRLRRYDDEGKDPEGSVPRVESYSALMYEHLRQQTREHARLPTIARLQCR